MKAAMGERMISIMAEKPRNHPSATKPTSGPAGQAAAGPEEPVSDRLFVHARYGA
jgi:hypothetical protein